MWDDFVIGKGDELNGSRRCFDIDSGFSELDLSENRNSYWICNAFSCIGGIIFKDTDEGQAITQLRKDTCDVDFIVKEIETMIVPYLSLRNIYLIKEAAYKQGKRDKMEEIKSVLTCC